MSETSDSKAVIEHTYTLFTYVDMWEKKKADLSMTDEELRDAVEGALQMWAWGDILADITENPFEKGGDGDV